MDGETPPSRARPSQQTDETPTDLAPVETPRLFPHLTALQEGFVRHYVLNGGKTVAAARSAGYSHAGCRSVAYAMLANPLIVRAIYETTAVSLGAHLPAALAKVAKLSSGAKSEYVALEASRDLLDRAGLSAPKKVNVSGGVNVTFDLT